VVPSQPFSRPANDQTPCRFPQNPNLRLDSSLTTSEDPCFGYLIRVEMYTLVVVDLKVGQITQTVSSSQALSNPKLPVKIGV